jgi:hypothetical protein
MEETENEPFENFCEKHGIFHEFSYNRTPQQNEGCREKE